MGFTNLPAGTGLTVLNNWLLTRSYITGHAPTQADVACFKALKSSPDIAKYPHAARWFTHIATYESEFSNLSGDATKPYTVYGPEVAEITANFSVALAADDDNDDVNLFGSDDEDENEEVVRIREERLAEYRRRREGKVKPAAKSLVTLDVKPWGEQLISYELTSFADDETSMVALEAAVRGIEKDGLVWGQSKLVAIGFGIKKLQINLVVEDDKVSTDDLQEQIQDFEDYVQSSDVVAMQKL